MFCEAVGKSGKDNASNADIKVQNILVDHSLLQNISSFCQGFCSYLFRFKKKWTKIYKNNLPKNIKLDYVVKENSPTILRLDILNTLIQQNFLASIR